MFDTRQHLSSTTPNLLVFSWLCSCVCLICAFSCLICAFSCSSCFVVLHCVALRTSYDALNVQLLVCSLAQGCVDYPIPRYSMHANTSILLINRKNPRIRLWPRSTLTEQICLKGRDYRDVSHSRGWGETYKRFFYKLGVRMAPRARALPFRHTRRCNLSSLFLSPPPPN